MNYNITPEERQRMKSRISKIIEQIPDTHWPCAIVVVSPSGHGYVPLVSNDDREANEAVNEVIIDLALDISFRSDEQRVIRVTLDEGT